MDKQLTNRQCTWVSIRGHASLRIAVGISSLPGVEFLAFSIALFVSSKVIDGNGRDLCATIGALIGMSPISARFESRQSARILHLSVSVVAGGFSGKLRFFSGIERYIPTDLCHLVAENISLAVLAFSILDLKKASFSLFKILR